MCTGLELGAMQGMSMAMTAVGTMVSAIGAIQQANAQSAMYEQQAKINEMEASDSVERGMEEQREHRRKVQLLMGKQKAAYGASGLSAGDGTPVDMLEDTAYMAELDAATIRYNAQRERWGHLNNANINRASAKNARTAGKWNAFSTILGGATTVADKWYSFNS